MTIIPILDPPGSAPLIFRFIFPGAHLNVGMRFTSSSRDFQDRRQDCCRRHFRRNAHCRIAFRLAWAAGQKAYHFRLIGMGKWTHTAAHRTSYQDRRHSRQCQRILSASFRPATHHGFCAQKLWKGCWARVYSLLSWGESNVILDINGEYRQLTSGWHSTFVIVFCSSRSIRPAPNTIRCQQSAKAETKFAAIRTIPTFWSISKGRLIDAAILQFLAHSDAVRRGRPLVCSANQK